MKKLIGVAVLLAGLVGVAVEAYSYNCTTTCTGYGNMRTCNTNCW